jgi:nitrate/TMAO reductase-like tetraheme cytochrome c subunit
MADDAPRPPEHKKPPMHRPGLIRNTWSMTGAVLAVIVLSNILFLFLVDSISPRPNPYIGILAYMILPGFLFVALLLIPVGMLRERRRRHRAAPADVTPYPRIDLNDPRHRKTFVFFSSVTVVFLFLSAIGSYRAYEYTDSVEFCGQLCHSVMNPQYTAYQESPHARVTCVQCHVGPGATWYARSKMDGLYQVYATAFNKFPRPIPTPVHSLRPAQDTCEQCHWPEKFHGERLKVIHHFAADEENTAREIRLLIQTGGGSPMRGPVAGIHWHMNIANEITYIAADDQHQVIPWVRMRDRQGRVREFKQRDSELTPEQIAASPKHRMDCVSCHNRPSHIYDPPDRAVNQSLYLGKLDPTLPWVKKVTVEALSATYDSTPQAMEGIATYINRFYQTEHAQLFAERRPAIMAAVEESQRIFRSNMFPEMKVDWRTHPDNIGHFIYPGCFRCHNGEHESAEGELIRNECGICHTTLAQTEAGQAVALTDGMFEHPLPMGDMRGMMCNDCHSGGLEPANVSRTLLRR